jgi:hypothetical protein
VQSNTQQGEFELTDGSVHQAGDCSTARKRGARNIIGW